VTVLGRGHNSIKGWLITIVVLSQTLLAVGLILTGILYTKRQALSTLDNHIQAHAMSVAALVRYTEAEDGSLYFDDSLMPPSVDPSHPDWYAVWTEKAGLLTRSANWPPAFKMPPNSPDHWSFKWDNIGYRGLRLFRVPVLDREEGDTFHPRTLTIVYASPTARLDQQVKQSGFYIALSSLLLLAVTIPLALWGIRRGLSPLQKLAERAALVSTETWELRLPEEIQQVKELRPLTESMKTMLDRLRHSFDQQREFLGNSAHELKTPVAVLKSTLQSLLHRPRSLEEYRAGIEHSLEDLERLEELLQWIMRLARAEQWARGALRRDLEVIDISATCEDAIERIRALAESRKTTVHFSKSGPVPFRADPEDLQLVWINLLENAVRYSPEGGSVEVSVSWGNNGGAQIIFEDHGAGIDAAQIPHIFERFYRADPSRNRATGGFGLGLAIVKALVEAYGGMITAQSAPGEGTRMTVVLPASPGTDSLEIIHQTAVSPNHVQLIS
jgi:signal transduction histidine kinase